MTVAASCPLSKKSFTINDVYLPWIRELRKQLGWVEDQPVPENLKVVSWCDGDIGQLQTMLFESLEAKDETKRNCQNKHSAAATGTQQPADLALIFQVVRQMASSVMAKGDSAVAWSITILTLCSTTLRKQGLNLDGNGQKKKGLIDLLVCNPETHETGLKKKNIKKAFVEEGIIDEATGTAPVLEISRYL